MSNMALAETKQTKTGHIVSWHRVWRFLSPTTIKGVITIVHHSGHQVEAFISVFLSDLEVKTDNICSMVPYCPWPPSLFLGSLSFTALPVLQNYHLTRTAVGQIAVLASIAVALILGLETLRFELWFHFNWIEKINSYSIWCRGEKTLACWRACDR